MTNKPRETEGRELSSRSKSERPSIKYFHVSTSNLDKEIIPEGMRYAKITKECRGNIMNNNVRHALQMGYRPVPKTRHPELCLADDLLVQLGDNTGKTSYIEDRDHILMEIPEDRYNEIEAANREATESQTRFANELGNAGMNDDPHVYLTRPQSSTRFESGGVNLTKKTNFGHNIT